MTHRRCGTCKHFEQAPIFRKGWCRNPLLYSPQQSHLVSDEDLDCERGMGNYWEPSDDYVMTHPRVFAHLNRQDQTPDDPSSDTGTRQLRSSRGVPIYPVSGSSGYGSEPPPPGGSDPSGGWGGDDRNQFGYYEEERYWTDYIRIVLPLLGVLLLVIVLWFWIANALGDDDDDNGEVAGGDATSTETLPAVISDETPTEVAAGTGAPPGTAVVPTPTTAPDGGTVPADTEAPSNGGTGALFNGATAEVANTGGTGVNVRAEPTTSAEILNVYLDGTQVQIIGEPVEAEGFTWWPVTGEAVELGYIVEEYLVLVE